MNQRNRLQGRSLKMTASALACFIAIASAARAEENKNTLGLNQYMDIVTGNNIRIQSGELDWDISRYATEREEGAFDLGLKGSFSQEKNQQRNTVQESLSRSSLSEFEEENKRYNLNLYKKIETGATLELELNRQDLRNSVQPGFVYGKEHVFKAGVKVRQPLLKGNWRAATLERDIALKGEDVAYQDFRRLRLAESNNAVQAYWDFYQTQGNLKISQHSIDLLKDMLDHSRQRVRMGMVPMTDVMQIESRLAAEKAIFTQGKQQYAAAMNQLKNFMAVTVDPAYQAIETDNKDFEVMISSLQAPAVDSAESFKVAQKRNPQILSSRYVAEQENLKLVFAKDQTSVSLDLVASYHQNGLDNDFRNSVSDTFTGKYPGYTVGLEFNIPLTNHLGRGEVGAASARKQQALYAIKDTEVKLSNQISTLAEDIRNKYDNIIQLKKVKEINEQLFSIHSNSYQKGKVSIDDVIKSERRLEVTRAELLAALIGYQKAIFQLKEVEGSLLTHFDIDEPLIPEQDKELPL
ncbi:TolC family protein [Parendozoicomonas sp. Alg238-R29]|uniref:TolC family protein n=1 Tax=Parendozoicomonas sp. Alg238-R29 TaxID=2993446 RepID=UPI00248EA9F3|nr:TolC family protein [Parendozoicomonas sp. Alg238-R29]